MQETSCGNLSMGCFLCRLISEIQKHSTVIIIGETGSGKTTQIPQFMHEVRLDKNGIIGITQVRIPICFLKTVKVTVLKHLHGVHPVVYHNDKKGYLQPSPQQCCIVYSYIHFCIFRGFLPDDGP
jgi:Tfp pilus assembly ATPase PilU